MGRLVKCQAKNCRNGGKVDTDEAFVYYHYTKKGNLQKKKYCNRKLFEFSLISFVNHGYKIEEISLDLHNDDYKDNIETEYETKFSNLGQNIYMVKVSKM